MEALHKLTAVGFLSAWIEAANEKKDLLSSIWRTSKEFTFAIKGSDNSVIDEVAEKLGLHSYPRDYYSLDAILYEKNDLTPDIPSGTFWFRDIRVAFEHENNFSGGLYQEVSHLLITNADIKVLVTYPNCGNPFVELDYLHKIIRETRQAQTISDKENFLIILGYEKGFIWEGFIFKMNNWERILPYSFPIIELEKQLEKVCLDKTNAIKEQKFELASALHDKEVEIKKQIDKIGNF